MTTKMKPPSLWNKNKLSYESILTGKHSHKNGFLAYFFALEAVNENGIYKQTKTEKLNNQPDSGPLFILSYEVHADGLTIFVGN